MELSTIHKFFKLTYLSTLSTYDEKYLSYALVIEADPVMPMFLNFNELLLDQSIVLSQRD